jgi:hypothetical protein
MGREAGARCGHFGTVEAALFCHGDGNGQKGTVTAAASATTRQNDPSREVAASHSFVHSISRSQRTSSFRRQASAWHANKLSHSNHPAPPLGRERLSTFTASHCFVSGDRKTV